MTDASPLLPAEGWPGGDWPLGRQARPPAADL